MELTGKITIIEPTESGLSKTTGNPWVSKNIVLEVEDEGRTSHFALRFMDKEDVTKLTECQVGDIIRCTVRFHVTANNWTNREGKQVTIRKNEVTCYDVELVKMEAL